MKLHNQEIQLQFNSIMAGLTIARDEVIDTINSCRDHGHTEVFEVYEQELVTVDKAIDQLREWAIKLDQSISTSNF